MFRDVSKALSWAYMMQEKVIIDRPSMAGMFGSGACSRNDLLIGLNAQEAIQQAADIVRIVDTLEDKSCAQYIGAKYGRNFTCINDLVERVISRLGTGIAYRRGVQYIVAKYCGERITKEQIRQGLQCDNNRVGDVSDKVYCVLDDVHKVAIVSVESKLIDKGLV